MRHSRRTPARTAPGLAALVLLALAACGEGSATEAGIGPGATGTDAPATDAPADTSTDTTGPADTTEPTGPATEPAAPAAGPRYEFTGPVLEEGDAFGAGHGPELCVGGIQESLPPQCGGVPVAGWSWDGVPGAQTASGTTWASGLRLVGTYDGEVFTPTEPAVVADPATIAAAAGATPDFSPACDQPSLGDPALMTQQHFSDGAAAAGARPDAVAVWVDDQGAATDWLLNVEVTGDVAGAEAAVRQRWGGRLCTVAAPERPTAAELGAVQQQLPGVLGETVYTSAPDTLAGRVDAEVLVASPELQARADAAFGPGVVSLAGTLRPL